MSEFAFSVVLKRGEERRLLSGHQWIFSNEIQSTSGPIPNGETVKVFDAGNSLLGIGFYNKNSLIAVRLFDRTAPDSMEQLIEQRLETAYEFRKTLMDAADSFRMVFGESDLLPGLIIDKFNDTFVMQVNCAGIERYASFIAGLLQSRYFARNVFTKHDEKYRALEGLPAGNTIYAGSVGEEIISDGQIRYSIDFGASQKTGFYLDQAENRKFLRRFVKDKTVLDMFCNAGGFGLHALAAGAAHVTFVDASKREMESVQKNIHVNGLDNMPPAKCIAADAFEYFQSATLAGEKFDTVIIDPPGFAKSGKDAKIAFKAYEKLHRLALRTLSRNGILATSSCSHYLRRDDFLTVIETAARKEGMRLQLLHFSGAAPDHPVLVGMPETSYLKFAVLRLIS